ncbi:MAG TPA: AzlD domain-containing protein [Ktedonobacterales bacterium]|jgi:branched-subunit amino acid transport protein|nr:AzlD domain-containing protein [Ktedonobacterales bacterium]
MVLALSITLIGVLTYLMRVAFVGPSKLSLPPTVERSLRFVPAAALTALIVPDLVGHNGALVLTLANARLIAGVVAFIIAWRTRNVALTLVVGMALFWLLSALLPR